MFILVDRLGVGRTTFVNRCYQIDEQYTYLNLCTAFLSQSESMIAGTMVKSEAS